MAYPASKQLGPGSAGSAVVTNRLINPSFAVNQRGYVSAAALAAGAYGHDRWKAGANGATYSFTSATPDTTVNITSGSLLQVVAGSNVEGGTYTLSWAGTATARIGYTSGGNGVTTAYASSPITISGVDAGTVMSPEFQGGTVLTPQIGPGASPGAYDRRLIGQEVLLCYRYFFINGGMVGGFGNSTQATVAVTFPTLMAAVPTVALVNGKVNGGSALAPFSAQHVVTSISGTATLTTAGGRFDINVQNSASGVCIIEPGTFSFSAEL